MTPRFEEEISLIKKVIIDFGEGHRSNLAVISDPFYGESELVDRVEGMTGEEGIRINARTLIRDLEALEDARGRIVIIEEVHRLYRRKIGGFDTMNSFLKMLVCSDRLFITTWNSYSWKYLDEVLDLGRYFSRQIKLPKMGADQIRDMLLSGYEEGELTFVEEEPPKAEELKVLSRGSYKKTLMGHCVQIPRPVVDTRSVRSRLTKTEKKPPEDVFFDRLTRISDGNPGVAEYLWKEALDYPQVRNALKDPPSIGLDYDDSFALSIVLSMGSVEVEELSDVLEPLDLSAERVVGLLEEMELVFLEGDVVAIRSEALKSVVEHLRRLRLVW
ncbi:MAG TPA: hypothetical protein PLM24_08990 [Methanothrix sp.]|nr:hypothetical protein [Methanothrix sp.]HPJ84370.1 hypothetical protein [Methanothrix sp.]HPR67253.1 hypothetical protein [Methanothrix sp.]